MEWMLPAALVIGLPISLAVWLIVRAVQAGKRIEELSSRLFDLEREIARLKKAQAPLHETEATRPAEPAAIEPILQTATTPLPTPAPAPQPAPEEFPLASPKSSVPPPLPPIIPPLARPIPEPMPLPPLIPVAASSERALAPPPISTASAEAALAIESPREVALPPVPEKGSFEMRLGTYWLVRVGAVMLLTGLAFFGNLAYQKFSAGGKVALLYLASGLLLGAGAWWQRKVVKESLRNYGQVIFAGGLAAVYFTTYAAHHVTQLRVIPSATLDGVLLLAWAGFIAWIADRKKSEVLALFAVGLAYYTGVITRVGMFTLYSNLVLTLVAVFFLIRNRWAWLSFVSLVATYAAYAFWRFFHGGEWRWATPEEGLWHSAYFLVSYWVVFTAAVFLSKHERLVGPNRAGFITLNNGAFFTLFLITMLQVEKGEFWKFSLIYGTVLLALAGVARLTLSAEPLAKNAYLTQGLLLVTLGFISKFAGLQLALVLATESVVLLILGTQRRSLILQVGAYLTGAMSVGWGIDGLERFDTRGLWLGSALGGLMALNSFWTRRETAPENRQEFRAVPAFFAALALIMWGFTTWQNTTHADFGLVLAIGALLLTLSLYVLRMPELTLLGQGYIFVAQAAWYFNDSEHTAQLTALALAVNCLALLRLGWKRTNLALQTAGYLSALLAVAWGIEGLGKYQTPGLFTGIALFAMMVLGAFLLHRQRGEPDPNSLRAGPTYFSVLAVVIAIATTWFNTRQVECPLFLAGEAVLLTASIYLLRMRELALVGQLLLLAAHCVWQLNLRRLGAPPWWNPMLMIGMTLGLGHWWQKQKFVSAETRLAFQLALSLLFVLLVCTWLDRASSDATWLALTCVLAVAVTAYAVWTRAWLLAACAQLFLLPGAWLFFQQLSRDGGTRFAALAPIAALGVLSFAAVQWFKQKADANERVRDPLLALAMAYRWVALAMSLWWVMEYVARREQIWVLMLIGLVVFAFAGWRKSRETLLFGAAFTGLSLLLLWARSIEPTGYVYLPNGLAVLALLGQQQAAKRLPSRFNLDPRIQAAIIVVGGLTLWRFVSCWVMQGEGGFYLTASWSVLALLLFGCGILLRERMYRWVGLGVLAGAIGRVVVFDVWKQETIYRVLTFMALGVVLLVVGFMYNKYQEKIRQWL